VKGGELYDRLEKGEFSEEGARSVMTQLLDAVTYLHSIGIVHRDLKPENVLFCEKKENSRIILTDFGIAAMPGSEPMTAPSGTLGYAAPEVVNRQPYDSKVDSWSLGVIAYILLVGYPPMNFENNEELLRSSQLGQYKFESPFWDHVSAEAKDFVASLMNPNPSKRLSCKQALRHPWILGRKILSQNQLDVLRSKQRAAFSAVRWLVRVQKCASESHNKPETEVVSNDTENKIVMETLLVPHSTKRLSTNGSIPEKFKEELAEKASISEMSISLEDETYAFLLENDDEDSGELVA
jgi:serine/threonine protein kinase